MTSIIILTYNQLEHTKRCIEAVRASTDMNDCEIIVVDNASTDGTREWLTEKQEHGDIVIAHFEDENIGVPAGWNRGLSLSNPLTDYLVILNNDVFVTPGWLEKMIRIAELSPLNGPIGMVGPVTNYASGPQGNGQIGLGMTVIFWRLVGFCLLIKREVIDKVGLFDERFGRGNFEDDDYCLRVIEAGYKNVICGDCFVYHAGSASWEPGALNEQLIKNKKIFDEKWPADKIKGLIG